MSAYEEPKKELYAEAIRTIPGVLAARERGSREDVVTLLDAYFAAGQARGLARPACWSVLFAAMTAQMSSVLREVAGLQSQGIDEVIGTLATNAALWVADTRGVSGY